MRGRPLHLLREGSGVVLAAQPARHAVDHRSLGAGKRRRDRRQAGGLRAHHRQRGPALIVAVDTGRRRQHEEVVRGERLAVRVAETGGQLRVDDRYPGRQAATLDVGLDCRPERPVADHGEPRIDAGAHHPIERVDQVLVPLFLDEARGDQKADRSSGCGTRLIRILLDARGQIPDDELLGRAADGEQPVADRIAQHDHAIHAREHLGEVLAPALNPQGRAAVHAVEGHDGRQAGRADERQRHDAGRPEMRMDHVAVEFARAREAEAVEETQRERRRRPDRCRGARSRRAAHELRELTPQPAARAHPEGRQDVFVHGTAVEIVGVRQNRRLVLDQVGRQEQRRVLGPAQEIWMDLIEERRRVRIPDMNDPHAGTSPTPMIFVVRIRGFSSARPRSKKYHRRSRTRHSAASRLNARRRSVRPGGICARRTTGANPARSRNRRSVCSVGVHRIASSLFAIAVEHFDDDAAAGLQRLADDPQRVDDAVARDVINDVLQDDRVERACPAREHARPVVVDGDWRPHASPGGGDGVRIAIESLERLIAQACQEREDAPGPAADVEDDGIA